MSLETITLNKTNFYYPYEDPIDDPYYDRHDKSSLIIYEGCIHLTFEILKFFINIGGLATNIYLIVIMCRFKKLRNRINNLILLYVIFNLSRFLLDVVFLIMDFCVLESFDKLMITGRFFSLTFLALDWYLLNYHSGVYNKYPRVFKCGIKIGFISVAVIELITTSSICVVDVIILPEMQVLVEYTSFVFGGVVLIYIAMFRRVRKPITDICKTEYAFVIPKVVFLLHLPFYIAETVDFHRYHQGPPKLSVLILLWYFIACTVQALALLAPIIVVLLLGKYNKYFKTAFLKCCKRNVQQYDDDDLDSGSINESPENVTFDNKTGEISSINLNGNI